MPFRFTCRWTQIFFIQILHFKIWIMLFWNINLAIGNRLIRNQSQLHAVAFWLTCSSFDMSVLYITNMTSETRFREQIEIVTIATTGAVMGRGDCCTFSNTSKLWMCWHFSDKAKAKSGEALTQTVWLLLNKALPIVLFPVYNKLMTILWFLGSATLALSLEIAMNR